MKIFSGTSNSEFAKLVSKHLNCPLSDVRRLWISRILEYDGYSEAEGAIQGWIKFAESTEIFFPIFQFG